MYKFIEPPEYADVSESKNSSKKTIIVFIISIIAFAVTIFQFSPDYNSGVLWALLMSAIVGIISLGVVSAMFPNEIAIENAKKFKEHHKFSGNVCLIQLKSRILNIPNVQTVMWCANNELHISSNRYQDDFGEIVIPYKNIVFFVRDGDFYTKTQLHRNGRIIGAALAGPAGFLIGTNTSASTIEVDKRQTILYLECDGKEETWFFSSESYECFMALIPQFEYKMVVSKPDSKNTNNNSDNLDQIKKLKELLDLGAISQEEFDKKKKELL